ncbi:hypothetical protein [Edaphocola aurantiacus]|uniref:hypothetical protein n=1 Tax=Edaphocola aurantiacus TaxID=2601682 RepID=UPI001C96A719|nr:hypothetical protein [Edaphocola aurantiacus]
MEFITPKMKDSLLHYLLEQGSKNELIEMDIASATKVLEINPLFIKMILDQFNSLGFINLFDTKGFDALTLNANAYDFYARKGFVAQEELFIKNIEKLEHELESIKSSFPEKAAQFATILSGISSYIALFK